jgi:hypothetical protein
MINDNKINWTNHIVEHVFIGIYKSHGCKKYYMPTWGYSVSFKGQNRKKKRKEICRLIMLSIGSVCTTKGVSNISSAISLIHLILLISCNNLYVTKIRDFPVK